MSQLAGRRMTVAVPASSANLGVGYDVLALALDLHLRVSAQVTDDGGESVFDVRGEGASELRERSNSYLAALRPGFEAIGAPHPTAMRHEMVSEIPLARGLGSSAAASVAGLAIVHALSRGVLDREPLLAGATVLEGHPDNAAAAVYGGFVVVAGQRVVRYEPPPGLRAVVFVAERRLPTEQMRRVVPRSVPHADAVHNMARTAMVVSAFATGDMSLLGAMYEDRLHEPYRAAVYPEFPALVDAAREAGAHGAALSGSGSSVIALCDAAVAPAVADAFDESARRLSLAGSAREVRLAREGARIVGDSS